MSESVNTSKVMPERKKLFRMIIPCYPAFNIYSSIANRTTALGPVMIATIVSKMNGWNVEVIDENNYHRYGPKTDDGKPDHAVLQRIRTADVVGFYGGLTSTIPRLYELAGFYKKQGVINIAGGQHFIGENIQEAIDNNIDYVIIGEGDITIKELLEALSRREYPENVAGIAFCRNSELTITPPRAEIDDFTDLPLPDFSLLHHAKISLFPVSWVRGCGMHCEFCTVKGNVRLASPDFLLNQIASLFERMNAKYFFIVDDLFGQNRKLALSFCRRLKEYQELMGVRFYITVQIRLDRAKDPELLQVMRQAGIRLVAIGYETPIAEELEAMHKELHPDEMIALTRVFHKAGFLVHGMFIFGYPAKEGQHFLLPAKERIRVFRKFIKKARIDTVQILLPVPLPGTELTKRLNDEGKIFPRETMGWEYYDGNFPLFIPDEPLTAQEMYTSIKVLMGHFYQFRYLFSIGMNVLLFPMILFPTFNIRSGWHKWYRSWRNNIWRFVGWGILRKWSSKFHKDTFAHKLNISEIALCNKKK